MSECSLPEKECEHSSHKEVATENKVEQVQQKEQLTEVTSVAKEELKTGNKVQMPSPEEIVHRASSSYISGLQELERLFRSGKISNRGMTRTMIAILSLPSDGVPVKLKDSTEKYAFAVGQGVIRDRFLITQYHVVQEQKIIRALEKEKLEHQKAIEKLREEGKSEEEIKELAEKQQKALKDMEKTLRGEDSEVELEQETEETVEKGENNEQQ